MYIYIYIYIYTYTQEYTYLFICFKTPMSNGHHDVRRDVRRDIHKGLLKELCARPLVSMPAHGGPPRRALMIFTEVFSNVMIIVIVNVMALSNI